MVSDTGAVNPREAVPKIPVLSSAYISNSGYFRQRFLMEHVFANKIICSDHCIFHCPITARVLKDYSENKEIGRLFVILC
jgi:hypothetical protein